MVRPSTTISNRLASVGLHSWTRDHLLLCTPVRLPAPMQIPLLPKPLLPRTLRWWPQQSRRRPHRQVREEKGRGSWRGRHNTRKGCGSIRVDQDVGNAIRTLLARGPLCDLHNARSGSVKLGQMTRATVCSCTARAAGFCHPCFGSTGFSLSSCPGRNPRWHHKL